LRDTCKLKVESKSLAEANLKPSRVYSILHDHAPAAITATSLASNSPAVRRNIHQYLNRSRYVKPALTGKDLRALGLAPGPRIRDILDRLRAARMDGGVASRQGEEKLVRQWLREDTRLDNRH
jgi:tRNA nucleotidyltransferase (CCA-adding enzyme)